MLCGENGALCFLVKSTNSETEVLVMAANHALSNALALECINILLAIAYMFWYRNKFTSDTIHIIN
jgi:hypothetical protein